MVTSDDGVVCLPVELFGLEVCFDLAMEDADCCTLCWFVLVVVVVIVEASHVEPLGVRVVRFEGVVDDLDGCDGANFCVVALVVGQASCGLVNVEEWYDVDDTVDAVH